MTTLALIITDAGRAAIVNAQNTGTAPVVLSQIALGSATYDPTAAPGAARTALTTEIKRLSTFGSSVVADDTIHVTITDTSADTYTLSEIGLYTNGGVLFAFYAQTTPILEKGTEQLVLLSADIVLTSVPPGSVTIGDANFQVPPATTTRMGIIEIATDAEVDTGTDTARAVTPAGVKRRIDTRAPTTRKVTAGNGLTGGGTLAADRTLTLGTPSTLSSATTNAVSAESHTHQVTFPVISVAGKTGTITLTKSDVGLSNLANVLQAPATRKVTAGNGLTGGGDLSADRTLTLGTPGTLSGSTTNAVSTTSHTHAISAATTSLRGVVELATNAEVLAGTDTDRAVTPASLRAGLLAAFPVGAIYITATNSSPADFLGGTWSQIAGGRMLIGVGTLGSDTYAGGATGGAARVTLDVDEIPQHSHTASSAGSHTHATNIREAQESGTGTGNYQMTVATINAGAEIQSDSAGSHTHTISSTGGGAAHENRPPYLAVYFWRRTA